MNAPLVEPAIVRALVADDRPLLRRFVTHEAVVPISSAEDLQRRLAGDRRVYALAAVDGEVLAFLQVALTRAFPQRIEHIVHAPIARATPSFGTFYSITRVSPRARGQAGHLLRQASGALLEEHPQLTLSTLSPVPGFRAWCRKRLEARGVDDDAHLERLARQVAAGFAPEGAAHDLEQLMLAYLQSERSDGRILDPVARFHLGNQASIRRVLPGADASFDGLRRAYGMMVSYLYHPTKALPASPSPAHTTDALLTRLLEVPS